MNKTDLFVVRRGKVLKDTVTNDARLNLVRGNETEELALYHLYTNPNARQFFERLPDDKTLKKMLDEYGEKYEADRNAKYGRASDGVAADKVINDAKDEANEIVVAAKAEAAKIIDDAKAEAVDLVDGAKLQATGEIVVAAKAEAAKIIDDAKAEADKIVKDAKKTAKAGTAKTDPIME